MRRECFDKDTKMVDAGEAAGRGQSEGRGCAAKAESSAAVHREPGSVSPRGLLLLTPALLMPATPLITLMYHSSLGGREKQHNWITCCLVCLCETANTYINLSSPQEQTVEDCQTENSKC